MRMIRVFWCAILLVVLSQSGFAMLRILFSPDRASWAASNIVLVETTPIDGTFAVIESWKGDLSAGSHVVIPDLIPKANALPISAYPKRWTPADRSGVLEQIPGQPVGSRLVLFLRRNKPEAGDVRKSEWLGWSRGADDDSMKISAVWIDGGTVYSFTQLGFFTGGPPGLCIYHGCSMGAPHSQGCSEEEFRESVADVLRVQDEMAAAVAETDGHARALRLEPFVKSKMYPARLQALEELGKCGPSAVGTIGEMLDDPAYSERASELVDTMVKAGGKAVGGELNRRLERDLAFWVRTGPTLSRGWWNEDPTPSSPLRNRYGQTYRLVYGLEQTGYPGALNTAIKLRDFWRSLPQLDDPSGLSQMVEECDKLITLLQSN